MLNIITQEPRIQLLRTNRKFLLFSLTGLFATIANGLLYIAIPWLLLQVHNDIASVAWLMLCFWLPNACLGLLFGVLADRYSRRLLMIVNGLVRAILLLGFAYYFHICANYTALAMYLLMICGGIAVSIYWPVSIAFIREIVDNDKLLYANFIMDISYEIGNVIGMGFAGVVIKYLSPMWLMIICSVVFFLRSLIICFIKTDYVNRQETQETWWETLYRDFYLGVRYIFTKKALLIIYSIQLLLVLQYMLAPVLLSPFVKNILHASVTDFSHIEAMLSMGIIVGGIFVPLIAKRFGLLPSVGVGCILGGCFLIFFSFNRHVLQAELLYFALGVVLAVWPLVVTQAQHVTALDYQARVQSVFNSLMGVVILIFYWMMGMSSKWLTINILYLFVASLLWLAVILIICCRKQLRCY